VRLLLVVSALVVVSLTALVFQPVDPADFCARIDRAPTCLEKP